MLRLIEMRRWFSYLLCLRRPYHQIYLWTGNRFNNVWSCCCQHCTLDISCIKRDFLPTLPSPFVLLHCLRRARFGNKHALSHFWLLVSLGSFVLQKIVRGHCPSQFPYLESINLRQGARGSGSPKRGALFIFNYICHPRGCGIITCIYSIHNAMRTSWPQLSWHLL